MKKCYKIYLTEEDFNKLISKANQSGFYGRGSVSAYINKVANESICFLDSNVKALLSALQLRTVDGPKKYKKDKSN